MGGLGYLSVLSGLIVAIVWIRIALSVASIARDSRASGHHARAHVHAARLNLLLVVLVLTDATACWAFVTLTGWSSSLWPIVALPVLGGLYFYSASLALPSGPDVWTELNGWYWITRRPVLIGILLADIIWVSLAEIGERPEQWLLLIAGAALNLAAFLVAFASTKRRLAGLALAVLIAERLALVAVSPLG